MRATPLGNQPFPRRPISRLQKHAPPVVAKAQPRKGGATDAMQGAALQILRLRPRKEIPELKSNAEISANATATKMQQGDRSTDTLLQEQPRQWMVTRHFPSTRREIRDARRVKAQNGSRGIAIQQRRVPGTKSQVGSNGGRTGGLPRSRLRNASRKGRHLTDRQQKERLHPSCTRHRSALYRGNIRHARQSGNGSGRRRRRRRRDTTRRQRARGRKERSRRI